MVLRSRAGRVDALGPLQLADLLLHLLGLGVLGPEAADEGLGRVDLPLLVLGGVDQSLVALPLLLLEVVVVARVEVDDAPVEIGDVGDHPVEEVAVVADDHQRARPGEQELLQPDEALEVEMVGGLVHEQQIGLLEQQPRQRHPHPPAPGQLGDRPAGSRVSRKPMPRRMA